MQTVTSMLQILALFIYVAFLFQVCQTQEYCEYGSYRSPRSGVDKCCIKCKTINLRELFREPQCLIEYNDCASDSGIYAFYNGVQDELTGSANPAIIHCPSDVVVNCDERKNFTTSKDYKLNVTEEGNIKDLQCTHPLGSLLELGSHLVICTATDLIKENEISCNFSVTVYDNQIPTIECVSMTFDTIPGKSYANVTYYPKVWDNSGEPFEVNCSLSQNGEKYRSLSPHFEKLHIGEHSITCIVLDSSLNMNTCFGSFFVRDNEIPYIECEDEDFTIDPGKTISNFTYMPKVWDNSGEELVPNCSIPNGSLLPAGNHSISCIVSDESMNINSCSANIAVIENKSDEVIGKISKNHWVWYIALIPLVVFLVVLYAAKLLYAKWKKYKRTKYNSSKFESCELNSGDPLVVKNCGTRFVEVQLSAELQQRCTKYTIETKKANNSSQLMEVKNDELNKILLFTDLSEEKDQTFNITEFTDNECLYSRRTQTITKHRNMSDMFAGCKLEDVEYNSITVNYINTGENLASNVWLVVRDTCCRQSDQTLNNYKEKKIDNPNSSLQHTFEGLKPGHSYDVTVELRTIMKVTIKDTYNIGHEKTKSVKISLEVNHCNAVFQFTGVNGDYEPSVSTCSCGIPTIEDNRVTINNLQPGCSYSISYGVTYSGKNIHQDKTTIHTKSAAVLPADTNCTCDIVDLLLKNRCQFEDLIILIEKEDMFLERLATALQMNDSFIVFKNGARKLENKWSKFETLLHNRSTELDMKVNESLKFFKASFEGSEFVVADEREPLLGGDEDKFFMFCQLLDKVHTHCPACQPFFHQYVHNSSFYKYNFH